MFVRRVSLPLVALALAFAAASCSPPDPQGGGFATLPIKHSLLDAHNCYPYDGKWSDRVLRAMRTGYPIGIEQDVAWAGRPVVSHKAPTDGTEPSLEEYFFNRVRPVVENALRENKRDTWPLIVVHFDFKDNSEPLLRSVWELLGKYENWITTAPRGTEAGKIAPLNVKPLLVLTEDPDAQQRIFFDEVSPRTRLRIFGSAHTRTPQGKDKAETEHLLATTTPEQLLTEPAGNYRRWWNNSWHEVEEGGQRQAGDWSPADDARLRSLVDRAHKLGYWIRFYTLDGFSAEQGKERGWFESYNFGSLPAAQKRWKAAYAAGVDMIATDQYEDYASWRPKQ